EYYCWLYYSGVGLF
nr:immunoglobulin light chain junction region [Macaca mulatta]MOV97835.1 immunoglobulin light chain junction region [Macaca mulatta]MOW00183.1 immunoglobulin light chain junction region [Macaca mulatta]MOW01430.1 immunoglobulin light chain junction region [Macaca mulatta]MOX71531.1 immunoglobulin light chain junction region [Macaca mulatta]